METNVFFFFFGLTSLVIKPFKSINFVHIHDVGLFNIFEANLENVYFLFTPVKKVFVLSIILHIAKVIGPLKLLNKLYLLG